MMKNKLYASIFALAGLFTVNHANAQAESWFSMSRFTLELAIDMGDFELVGIDGGNELSVGNSNRENNTAIASLLGIGIGIDYKIMPGTEIFIHALYEFGNEDLGDRYVITSTDIGVRYAFFKTGIFHPMVKTSLAKYHLEGLSVYDPMINSQDKVRENIYNGFGLGLGAGFDIEFNRTLTANLAYNTILVFSASQDAENPANVDLENMPTMGHFSFSVRVTL